MGKINIAPDTIYTYEDVTFQDANRSDVTWAGLYTYWTIGTDTIEFNVYYVSGYTIDKQKNVALHELGHALGLDHSFSGNVMYGTVSTQTYLGSHDQTDYSALYP